MDNTSVRAGGPIAHAARAKAEDELLEAAERALDMLDSRRAHHPPEMIDPREGRVAKALRAAVRGVRDSAVEG